VEASFGLVIIYAVGIALVDTAMGVYAVSRNNAVCRTAAALAASGNPSEAERRVRMSIEQSGAGLGNVISPPQLVLPLDVSITSAPETRRDPDSGQVINPGGLVTGNITVKTRIEIRPFAMEIVLPRHGTLVFESSQSCPIHYVMPPGT